MTDAPRVKCYVGVSWTTPVILRVVHLDLALFLRAAEPGRTNEDAVATVEIAPDRAVVVLADGVGGGPDGALASRLAVEGVSRSVLARAHAGLSIRPGILEGIDAANAAILSHGRGAASTVAIVDVHGDYARSYHAGDSGVLMMGQRGRIKYASLDHSPVAYAVEAGLLDPTEALRHSDRHVVSNWLGSADLRVEMGPRVKLAARDTVLVASDGLLDNLSRPEVVDMVRRGPLARTADELASAVEQRMLRPRPEQASKVDDLSFALLRRAK